eukprot:scaffold328333_cov57-Tisochrysis_lutea.AAC.1
MMCFDVQALSAHTCMHFNMLSITRGSEQGALVLSCAHRPNNLSTAIRPEQTYYTLLATLWQIFGDTHGHVYICDCSLQTPTGAFLRAVLSARSSRFEVARLHVERARELMSTEFAALIEDGSMAAEQAASRGFVSVVLVVAMHRQLATHKRPGRGF